jgi:3-phosphoshikimate 1-carboxyvinyltransferase
MKQFVRPAKIDGQILAPASKSMAQRMLLLSSLLSCPSTIKLGALCADIVRCAEAVIALGAKVEFYDDRYIVSPNQQAPNSLVNCGESGTCFRMISALCARFTNPIELSGLGSLVSRPMDMIEDALLQLGVKVESNQHKLPLKICGPIKAGLVEIDGAISSQFLSGLLLALPFCEGQFAIKVNNLKSKPYVNLTLEALKVAGVEIHYSQDLKYFQIEGPQHLPGAEFEIEGDWSSISTMLVAGAICGSITISGASSESKQADKQLLKALEDAGAKLQWNSDKITVCAAELKAFKFDAEDCPDSIPALVALAVNCFGRTEISGAERLKHKESDRAQALCMEYSKIGAKVFCEGNLMLIDGVRPKGGTVYSHNDHRIAMSLALAGISSEQGVTIEEADVVSKSYPQFFEDLERVSIYE